MATAEARRHLAELMDARRIELRMTWKEVADAGGVSAEVLRDLRNGRTDRDVRPLTKRGIEDGLQWRPGSVDQILMGGYPVPLEGSPPSRRDDAPVFSGDVDEAGLRPYVRDVEAEIEAARAAHGPDATGAQVGTFNEQESEIWDNSPWPRGERARAIAVLRMLVDEALRPGERRAM